MTRITRRTLLLTSAATAFVLGTPIGRALAQADRSAEASRFVDQFGTELVRIVNGSADLSAKRQEMQPLVERALAVNEIGAFVLGPYWRVATPAQQQRFLELFHAVLIKNITDKLGDFRGVGFQMTQTVARGGDYYVGTLISRPNQQPNNAQWVVSFESGRPLIVDVVAEGTSLRQTQRSDYSAFISRNGRNVDALLNAMQRQVAS